MTHAVQARVYSGPSEAVATQQFEADAAEAAKHGWLPVSRSWVDTNLTVTYQARAAAATVTPTVPAHLRVRPRPGVWAYVKAIGVALLIAIVGYMAIVAFVRGTPLSGSAGLAIGLVSGIAVGGKSQHIQGLKGWFVVAASTVAGVVAIIALLVILVLSTVSNSLDQAALEAQEWAATPERQVVLQVDQILGDFISTMVRIGATRDGDPRDWVQSSQSDRERLGLLADQLDRVSATAPADRRTALMPLAAVLAREAQGFDDVATAISRRDDFAQAWAAMELKNAYRDTPMAMRAFLNGYRDVLTDSEIRQMEGVLALTSATQERLSTSPSQ